MLSHKPLFLTAIKSLQELLLTDVIKKQPKKHHFGHHPTSEGSKKSKKPSIKSSYSRPFFYFYIPKLAPKTRNGGQNSRFWQSIPFSVLDKSFSILFLVVNKIQIINIGKTNSADALLQKSMQPFLDQTITTIKNSQKLPKTTTLVQQQKKQPQIITSISNQLPIRKVARSEKVPTSKQRHLYRPPIKIKQINYYRPEIFGPWACTWAQRPTPPPSSITSSWE